MFEQVLSLLFTCHRLSGRGLISTKRPSSLHGLQRMYVFLPSSSSLNFFLSFSLVRRRSPLAKLSTPYRPADLGLVLPLRELRIDLFVRCAKRKNKSRSFLISMMMSFVKRHRWSTNASRSASETTENTSLPTNSSTDDSQSEFSNHPSRPVRHLFLIRHGQYQRRRTQSNGHLTAKGQKQARYTANFLLSQLPDDVLFDSLTHSDSKETFDQC